jgi:hypothetical protein
MSYIYRTSDNLYLIYSEWACQYSNESTRTRFELTRPFTVNQKQNVTCSVNCRMIQWNVSTCKNPCTWHWKFNARVVASYKLHPHVYCKLYLRYSIPDFKGKHSLQNTWHFVSDLQWRGVSIQISSLRTRLNIDTPIHFKSDANYHLFCKYN